MSMLAVVHSEGMLLHQSSDVASRIPTHSTSVESQRTLPAVKKIHEFYGKQGLRVVGVHRPRYEFARSLFLVAESVKRLDIDYPVVNDVEADIAHAYGAQKLDTMFLVNDDNLIVGRKSGREASAEMLSVVCKNLSSKKGAGCLAVVASASLKGASLKGLDEDAADTHKDAKQQGLYIHYNGNPNFRYGARCRAATPDVFVGEARSSDLDVGTSAGRGSLTALQSYSSLLQRKTYSDLSGVQLHDGQFVLRSCPKAALLVCVCLCLSVVSTDGWMD